MEIEQSPLFKEIKNIIDEGPKPISFYWKAKIHAGDKDIEPLKLIDLDIKKDYLNNYADEVTLRLLIPFGLWAKVIYPNRTKLDITLLKNPLNETEDSENKEDEIETMRYSASIVLSDNLPIPTGKDIDHYNVQEMNIKDMFEIDFQLFNKDIEKIRLVTVGGIFRRTNPENVIKSILAKECNKVKVEKGNIVSAVDIVEPDNKEEREHFLIPQGTKIYDLADYIQHNVGGVYNTGINSYYHDRKWYIYSLYDTTRLDKAKRTAVLMKIPKNRFSGIERTYRQDGDVLYILGTSNSDFSDDAGTNFLNSGNGVRFSEARRYLRDMVEKKDNKAIVKRNRNNHEYVFKKRKSDIREEEFNNVQLSRAKINSNPFSERSSLSSKYGSTYQFHWDNGDASLLFPGMMVKIHYIDKDVMRELHGVLIFAHSTVQLRGQGITSNRHTNTIVMIIFANNPPGYKEDPDESENKDDDKEIDKWSKLESI